MNTIDERLAADPAVTEQYDRLLAAIGDVAPQIRDRLVTPFFPEVGSDYRGLVIVGQSTWGWDGEQAPGEYTTPEGRADALAYAKRVHRDREEPMSWLEDRKRNASAPFWAVTRLLAERFAPDSTAPWYGRFAWANLYPVSWQWPEPGNPGGPLRSAQDHLVPGAPGGHPACARREARRHLCRWLLVADRLDSSVRWARCGQQATEGGRADRRHGRRRRLSPGRRPAQRNEPRGVRGHARGCT